METFNKAYQFGVENNNLALVRWAFAQYTPDKTKINECLMMAVEKKQQDIINFLLTTVIVKSVKRPFLANSWSELLLTIQSNPKKAYQDLVSGVVSLEEINYVSGHDTPLIYVVQKADRIANAEDLVEKLLELDANINQPNGHGSTAIMYAARLAGNSSSDKMVEKLLKQGYIDVNIQDNFGMTALLYASEYVNTSTMKTLETLIRHPKMNHKAQDKRDNNALTFLLQCDIAVIKMVLPWFLDHLNADPKFVMSNVLKSGKSEHLAELLEMLIIHPKMKCSIEYPVSVSSTQLACLTMDNLKIMATTLAGNRAKVFVN